MAVPRRLAGDFKVPEKVTEVGDEEVTEKEGK